MMNEQPPVKEEIKEVQMQFADQEQLRMEAEIDQRRDLLKMRNQGFRRANTLLVDIQDIQNELGSELDKQDKGTLELLNKEYDDNFIQIKESRLLLGSAH